METQGSDGQGPQSQQRCKALVLRGLAKYINSTTSQLLSEKDSHLSGDTQSEQIEEAAVKLFKGAAELVPAYQKFLGESGVNPLDVKTLGDFASKVPLVEKSNYLSKYPLPQRCIGGKLSPGDVDFIHVSSGSTGTPTFWARSVLSEVSITQRFEQIMADAFGCDKQLTLAVIAFPLGSWVGGIFTTFAMRYITMKGFPITLVTPGNNVAEILRCVKDLAPMFQRTCILGYPPFIKGVIDAGISAKVPFESYNTCLVLAGEVFSEEWRSLVAERCGIKNPHRDIVSIYGTADAGVIGNETPLSAIIRQWVAEHPTVISKLFGKDRLPTLVQYDPNVRYIEVTEQNTLVLTAIDGAPEERVDADDEETRRMAEEVAREVQKETGSWPSGTAMIQTLAQTTRESSFSTPGHETSDGYLMSGPPPLLRYHIGDAGGIKSFEEMLTTLKNHGFNVMEDPKVKALQAEGSIRTLPFCWVFGRAHWCVSLYGANVFVDQVKECNL